MSRLTRGSTGRRQGGFTLVELLVTIIIAGIAFAALVPLFVSAQQVTAADQLRNIALQLAQDKIEKVRALDYDLITQANLESNTFANGQFGTSVTWATGGGHSRTFNVAYRVDLVPQGSQPGRESYKQVTVTVTWTAPPAPVKPAVLSTMVSKQYAGPQIVRFEVGPESVLESQGDHVVIVSGPVVIDAYIAPDDIASMNQSASEANRGYVEFTVSNANGGAVATAQVTMPVPGEPAHYQFIWDNASAPDGLYEFQAVAVAGFGSRAQGAPVSIALEYTSHAPDPPKNLSAVAGNGVVTLTWTAPNAPDLDHYEVWRSVAGGPWLKLGDTTATGYIDSGLTNGTTYSYKVRSVDSEGLSSVFTPVVTAVPAVPKDTLPPTVPAGLTATAVPDQPTIHLEWQPSVDQGNPATGVAGYIIERASIATGRWTTLEALYPATTYDDVTAGWGRTWYYRVSAVDNVQNASGWAGPVYATTDPLVLRSIEVTNTSTIQIYVWVQDSKTGLWYQTNGASSATRPASGVWVKKNGHSVTWSNLPRSIYNVYFCETSTWGAPVKTQAVDVMAGDGTATYP